MDLIQVNNYVKPYVEIPFWVVPVQKPYNRFHLSCNVDELSANTVMHRLAALLIETLMFLMGSRTLENNIFESTNVNKTLL